MPKKPTASSSAPKIDPALTPVESSWSWGAFWIDAFFLVSIKRYAFLFWYLLAFVPFLNMIVILVLKIYLGVKGREMAYQSDTFATKDEARGFLKAIDHAGKIFFYAMLILFGLGIIIAILFATIFSDSFLIE